MLETESKISRTTTLEFQDFFGVFQDLCLFQDFPGLEISTFSFKDFPGSVQTLPWNTAFISSTNHLPHQYTQHPWKMVSVAALILAHTQQDNTDCTLCTANNTSRLFTHVNTPPRRAALYAVNIGNKHRRNI